ncbi:hypothetical protein ACIQD3_02300 [Peribacillus loiseleuriae]
MNWIKWFREFTCGNPNNRLVPNMPQLTAKLHPKFTCKEIKTYAYITHA